MATYEETKPRPPGARDLRAVRGEVNAAKYVFSAAKSAAENLAALQYTVTEGLRSTLGGHYGIFLPPGLFDLPPHAFDLLNASIKWGLRFRGAGPNATVLRLVTGGADSWFFDNGPGAPRLQEVLFEGIGFTSDDKAHGHGFKVYSSGGDKEWNFRDCAFGNAVNLAFDATDTAGGLGTLLRMEGTGNADLTHMEQCFVDLQGDLLSLNNAQSVAHHFYNVRGNVRGNLVSVGAAGGGYVGFHGGSINMSDDGTTDLKYVLAIPNGSGVSQQNGQFAFNNMKFELKTAYKRLVDFSSASGHCKATFKGCGFPTVTGGNRKAVLIAAHQGVTFEDCNLHEDLEYEFQSTYSAQQDGGLLTIEDCLTGTSAEDITERITFLGNIGRAVGRKNRTYNSRSHLFRVAPDFDLNWRAGLASEPAALPKIAPLLPSFVGLPNGGAPSEYSTTLPEGALLRRIYVEKLSGGLAVPYQLAVSNGDKSLVYGLSAPNLQSAAHAIDAYPNRILSGATNRVVLLYAPTPGSTTTMPANCYVEYV